MPGQLYRSSRPSRGTPAAAADTPDARPVVRIVPTVVFHVTARSATAVAARGRATAVAVAAAADLCVRRHLGGHPASHRHAAGPAGERRRTHRSSFTEARHMKTVAGSARTGRRLSHRCPVWLAAVFAVIAAVNGTYRPAVVVTTADHLQEPEHRDRGQIGRRRRHSGSRGLETPITADTEGWLLYTCLIL